MTRAPQRPPLALSVSPISSAGRALLAVLIGIGILFPTLGRGGSVSAQASTVSFSTAEAAPADSFAYVVTTTDDQSEQWRLADELIDRAGFGEALDEALAEELSDETGEDLPLDAFLGGEVAVIVGQAALEAIAAESFDTGELDEMLGAIGMATPEAEPAALEGEGFAIALHARAPDTAWTGIRDSIRDEGGEESTYEGTTILYAPPASDDDDGYAAARVGDLVLIGLTPMDLHPVIDTADGRTPAITTLPEFTTAREALPDEFLTFAFSNSAVAMTADLGPFAAAAGELDDEAFSGMTVAAD
ncbi:MAG: hypothetical protein ACRDJC_04760, partial [Thermomicrobiales bacterium]